ncbi:hypothetical protein QR680_001513 [Steinernema hermaphroditum]|uniref:Uncharacterized protein n=1 Tax=Steinernema hermaphroditum TaxID=289476 RepID=A0AA39LG34_9BILA|nr:hypothetical protein QR680_001513 [Steinernema hermaphroditum]
MAFYFALLNVSNAHLDNRLHHGDPEAWEKGMTGYPTTGHRQPNDENPEYRWKWIAKLRHLSAERRGQRSSSTKESKFLVEPKAHRQRKLVAAVSIADEETEIWTSTPPPAYPGITDTPPEALIETSSDDFSESSPESASRFSSDQSSVSDLFDKKLPSKRKLSGMNRISRKPWRILTENNALDASWKSTKSLITMENFERIFTFNGHRPNTFRILRETSNCSEPISVLN